ncbi:MAG TPA: FAD-dependent oxidoreductase [Gaiellaceae bacterium]|nr:FAD-dependent oxidoreductase [Gaiellaceae bacterium]
MSVASEPVFEELRAPLERAEALAEADRCLECGGRHAPAPCMVACPAGVDVAQFVAAIASDDPERAAETIFAENLLGATCARVCPAEVLCEGACVLGDVGRPPIAIAALQRYATDLALANGAGIREPAQWNGRRVAVIGAGPAGLACAGELAALGYAVTVFDEREEVGGLVRYAIAPYRQLQEPLPDEAAALARIGVEFRLSSHVGKVELDAIVSQADAVFLAVGMGPDTQVSYPGDDLPGVWESLPFIEQIKTDAPPAVGRHVVVVGGGNTAIDVAREALRLGAAATTLVYRRGEGEMPAYAHEVAEARAEGIRFQFLADPIRILGADRAEAVLCRRMQLGEPDASGRRRPEPVPGSELTIEAETVVKAIGQQARRELADWVSALELEPAGTVHVDPPTGQTSNPKFFAGGDVVNGGTSVVEAVGEAKRAARAIDEWLR